MNTLSWETSTHGDIRANLMYSSPAQHARMENLVPPFHFDEHLQNATSMIWSRAALRSSESTKMRPTPRATSQMRTLTYADTILTNDAAIVLSSCVISRPYQQRFGIIPCECTSRKHFLIVCRSRVPDFSQISSFSLAYILYVSVQVDSSTMWKILTAI
jgi:hypothetical protein